MDKKESIDKCNRYYKLNLSGVFADTGNDGKISFTLPPLASNGFAKPSKNDCIIKFRKVIVDSDDERAENIYWGEFGDSAPKTRNAGITLLSNIQSRNNFFLQVADNGGSGMGTTDDEAYSKLGVTVKPASSFYDSSARKYYPLGGIHYQDFSKIEDSGTLCSNPFGQKVEFYFVDSQGGRQPLLPFDLSNGASRYANLLLRVELEIMVL